MLVIYLVETWSLLSSILGLSLAANRGEGGFILAVLAAATSQIYMRDLLGLSFGAVVPVLSFILIVFRQL